MTSSRLSNIPRYQTLCKKLIERDKKLTAAHMNDLLEVLGVQNTLDGLFLVLENYVQIADMATRICEKPKWHFASDIIADTVKVGKELLILRTDKTIKKLKTLDARLDAERNRTFHTWVEENPLYATIGYRPSNREHSPQYLHLVTHILIAHLLTKKREKDDDLAPQFEQALQAARSLCADEYLKPFPLPPLPPESYIGNLPQICDPRLAAITRYLSSALTLQSTYTLKQLGKLLSAGSVQGKNHDPLQRLYPVEPALKQLPQVIEEIPKSSDTENHYSSGRLLIVPRSAHTISPDQPLMELAQDVAKARCRENQFFHFSWPSLNQYDLENFFEFLQSRSSDFKKTKTQVQLLLMFAIGASPTRLSAFRISANQSEAPRKDAYLIESNRLRLHTPGPQYQTCLDEMAQIQAFRKQEHIELIIPPLFQDIFLRYIDDAKIRADHGQENGALFLDNASQIQQGCQKALAKINREYGTRLTLAKLQNFIPQKIAALQGSDLAASSLALGKEIYLARTRIHYAGFDPETLAGLCSQAWVEAAKTAGLEIIQEYSYPQQPAIVVGTPVRPQRQTVQNLITAVKAALSQTRRINTLQQLVDYHNTYVLYTALTLFYSTGYRAINAPFVTDHMLDPKTGYCVIRDKSAADGYHSRLVWLPDSCLMQLQLYRNHVEVLTGLDPCFSADFSRRDRAFFFLDSQGRRMRVTRSKMEDALRKFGFFLPANVQRHFIKSEMQENGCPAEIIEVFLGHWHHGEEGWTKDSALHPWNFREVMEKYLPALLRRIGLSPVRGLQRAPAQIRLLLHEQTVEEKQPSARRRQSQKDKQTLELLHRHPPGQAWFSILGQRFKNLDPVKAFKKQERITLATIHTYAPEIHGDATGKNVSAESLIKLLRRLRPRPMHTSAYVKRINFLIKGLTWGQSNLNWSVDIPALPILLPKEQNRVRPPLMRKVRTFREIEQTYISDLERPIPEDPKIRVAQILFSAVFYGALNDLSWAKAFVRGLGTNIYQHEDILWVDLWREPPNFAHDEEKHLAQRNPESYRRWLADPTTQLLIYRWLQHSPSDRQKSAPFDMNEVYLAYRKHIADGCGATLPDMEVILDVANARTTLHAPPFVSAYAEGKIHSTSLPDPAWLRVLTNKGYAHITPEENGVRQTSRAGKMDCDTKMQLGLLRQVRNTILRDKAAGANSRLITELEFFIHTKRHLMSPALVLLTQWATQLLSSRISKFELRKKSPEKASTVDKYLGLFSQQLLEECESIDIKDLAPDELRALFGRIVTKVIELKSPNLATSGKHEARQAKYTLHRLNQFLGYVHFFHGLPHLSVHTDGSVKIGKTVRANVITPEEFSNLLAALGWGQEPLSRQNRMTIIAAILAFRTGMRVAEICGLQIGDIQGTTQTEVLVRPNKFRGLKSRTSRRRLPLHILLPQDEFAYVREWHRFRSTELGATRTCPLFCQGPLETGPCSAQELFSTISETLKTITGDLTVVPHTLRHSFATWLLCKLLLGEDAEIQDDIGVFAGRDYDKTARKKLRTELLINENSGKKILHATAALLGHADTDTLLYTYMHLTDWFCRYYAREQSSRPPLTARGIAQILHCSHSHAAKILYSDKRLLSLARKKSLSWSERLKHPLAHQLHSRTASPQKQCSLGSLGFFDELFHQFHQNGSQSEKIKWPKTIIEMYAIHWIWEKLLRISGNQKKITCIIGQHILLGYRLHDKAIITYDVKIANQIFILLSNLEIEFTVKYYASRGENETEKEKSLHHWRKHSKGQAIGRGQHNSKKTCPKGIVRIFLSQIQLSGYHVEFDSRLSNIFLIILHIFLNSQQIESYLFSETTPKTS